jgi:hypothetical protein
MEAWVRIYETDDNRGNDDGSNSADIVADSTLL